VRELGIGASVPRYEDPRLLRGRGRYTGDIRVPGEAHLVVVRSPHAFARIVSVDTSAARAAPGVLAVFTGEDALAAGLGTLSCRVKRQARNGKPNFEPPYRLLAIGHARFVGDCVAAVVAETQAQAEDAAELVAIEWEPLPAVTEAVDALAPDAPQLWPEVPGNESFVFNLGNRDKVEAGFARAAHVARVDFVVSRVSANPMEARGAIGLHDPVEDRYTLHAGFQTPHLLRAELADFILKVPANRIRVVSPDLGGGFGQRGAPVPEYGLVLWAARELGRPVRWRASRTDLLIGDFHARDNASTAELALDADHRFLALRVRTVANMGAYLSLVGPHSPTNNLGGLAGVYTTPAIHAEVIGAFTNTAPTASYRGAGRPEASYAIERVIDQAARDLGLDPAELRRKNTIPAIREPWNTGFVFTYDSGEFEANMDRALAIADRAGFAARRAAAAARGRLAGQGMANAIEIAGGPLPVPNEEAAEIRFDPSGAVTLLMGTHSHGQGHETGFTQIVHELLGVEPAGVRVVYGDTDQIAHGRGTFGSRSVSVGGAALVRAADKLIARGKAMAAHLMEAAVDDVEFRDGRFVVAGTDRALTIAEVARASFVPGKLPSGMDMGLMESAVVLPPGPTFPNGCHVCEVEIDPETGHVEIVRYVVVDDVGIMLNPMMVKGQVHGGIVQGAGQMLMERMVYDPSSGQPLTGSFMDYAMPRAGDFPAFDVEANEVPAKTNPLGFKGAGEAGTVGALPAIANAVMDALAPFGVRHLDMPFTPERVWRALQDARAAAE